MIYRLLFILLLPLSVFAQSEADQLPYPPDTSTIDVRTVESSVLDSLTREDVFDYNEVAENPETFMSRVQRWLIQILQFIGNNRWAGLIIRFIFFAIFGIVLIALINQLLGGNLSSSFSSKKAGKSLSLNVSESEISHANYDSMLKEAIKESRFRDAVRILYLKALQDLNDRELITWKPDKTNHDYLRELGSHPSSTFFNKLTTYYEYVEYGDFSIEKPAFETVQQVYQQFESHTKS